MNWNFVIIFDISTDVYNIWFQNRLKVTPLTSFVGSMCQREGVIRFYKQYFNQHHVLGSKVGHDRTIDLQCQVAPWGYLLRTIYRGLCVSFFVFFLCCRMAWWSQISDYISPEVLKIPSIGWLLIMLKDNSSDFAICHIVQQNKHFAGEIN